MTNFAPMISIDLIQQGDQSQIVASCGLDSHSKLVFIKQGMSIKIIEEIANMNGVEKVFSFEINENKICMIQFFDNLKIFLTMKEGQIDEIECPSVL